MINLSGVEACCGVYVCKTPTTGCNGRATAALRLPLRAAESGREDDARVIEFAIKHGMPTMAPLSEAYLLAVFDVRSQVLGFLLYAFALTAVLLAVCCLKGEPPRWRWGEDGSKPPTSR